MSEYNLFDINPEYLRMINNYYATPKIHIPKPRILNEETASKIWERIKDFNEKDWDFNENVKSVYSEFGLFEKWQKLADECISYFTSRTDNEI